MARCEFCFRDKPSLQPVHPKISAKVCKACAFQIEKVIGLIEYHGGQVILQADFKDFKAQEAIKSKSGRGKVGNHSETEKDA